MIWPPRWPSSAARQVGAVSETPIADVAAAHAALARETAARMEAAKAAEEAARTAETARLNAK